MLSESEGMSSEFDFYFVFGPPSTLLWSRQLWFSFCGPGHCERGRRKQNKLWDKLIQWWCWRWSPCARKPAVQCEYILWLTHFSSAGEVIDYFPEYFVQVCVMCQLHSNKFICILEYSCFISYLVHCITRVIKSKVKLSHYMSWRCLWGEEV